MGFKNKETTDNEYGYEDYVKVVVRETELSEEEVKSLGDKKVEEYGGLVNRDGAIYLVADDYDVDINKVLGKDFDTNLSLENLQPDMYKLDIEELTVESVPNVLNGDGWDLVNIEISDGDSTIKLNLWNEDAKAAANELEEGDTIEVQRAYTDEYKSNLQLKIPKQGSIVSDGREII